MNTPVSPRERKDIEAILAAESSSSAQWLQRREVRWVGAVVLLALIAAIAWTFSGSKAAVRYVTEQAVRDRLVVLVTATGSVQPTNKVDVSSELSGTIRRVFVDYNSPVTAGQQLAELDTDKLVATVESSRAKLAAAKARVAEAEATVAEKERDLARKRELAAKDFTTQQDLDLAQAAYARALAALASARAEVGVAEADLKLNETNLGKACICSPINGVVLSRNVDPGQTVASSFQAPVLFSIAEDLQQMELQVDVDEADVGKVKEGQSATFTVDAFPELKFPATIRDVRYASETIQGVVTYKAVLTIDNSELLLRPGMTATAEIRVTEIEDALLVPNAALRYAPPAEDSGRSGGLLRSLLPGPGRFRAPSAREETAGSERTLWVLRNNEPTAIKVTVGPSDGRRTEIRSGDLNAGDAVIVDQLAAS